MTEYRTCQRCGKTKDVKTCFGYIVVKQAYTTVTGDVHHYSYQYPRKVCNTCNWPEERRKYREFKKLFPSIP